MMERSKAILTIGISFLICGSEIGANSSVSLQATLPAHGNFIYLKKDSVQGEQARPLQILFFRFPARLNRQIFIRVFDPDTSGAHDLTGDGDATKFEIYGGKKAYTDAQARLVFPEVEQQGTLLASKTFTSEFDNKWYEFGPFDVAQGERVAEWSYFKLVCHALTGKGENRFRVKATPENAAEALCYNASVVVPKDSDGLKLYLNSAGRHIIGVSAPYDPANGTATINSARRKIRLSVPKQGGWARYDLDLVEEETKKRLVYSFANHGKKDTRLLFTFTDSKGYPLPLFNSQFPLAFSPVETAEPKKTAYKKVTPAEERTASKVVTDAVPPLGKGRAADPNLTFVFDASGSFDPDNDKLSFEWEFGDGSPKVRHVKAAHTFEEPGSYKVTLTVSDGSRTANSTSQISQLVQVNIPPVIKVDLPEYARTGEKSVFDGSESSDSSGETLSYHWDFGDGNSATGAKSSHIYKKRGNYKVRLTVSDNRNLKNSSREIEGKVIVNTPPVAKAAFEILEGSQADTSAVILDAADSSDPDGDKLEYLWEFAGGVTMEGKRIKRTFTNSGIHTAKLIVKDDSGTPFNSSTDTIQIKLNSAPLAIASVSDSGYRGHELVFDGSGSKDPEGDKLSYLWTFGDGKIKEGQKVTHRYGSAGQYNVMLTVSDGQHKTSVNRVVRIHSSPVKVSLKAGDSVVGRPQNYEAVIEGEEAGLRFQWEFGDGSRYYGKTARHKYARAGTYQVQLTVHEGAERAYIAKASKTVHANTPPVAVLSTVDEPCCPGKTIRFDASKSNDADGHKLTYFWDFGDGNVSEKVSPIHTYTKGGVYRVSLTVTDGSGLPGSSALSSVTVKINRSPVPVINFASMGGSN